MLADVGEVSLLGWAFGGPFSLKILIFHVWEIFLDCLSDDFLSFP